MSWRNIEAEHSTEITVKCCHKGKRLHLSYSFGEDKDREDGGTRFPITSRSKLGDNWTTVSLISIFDQGIVCCSV